VTVQLVLATFKNIVILDAQHDVKIAVWRAFASGITFTGNAHLVSVIDTGGNFQFDGPLSNHAAIPPAGFAGIFDDLPGTAALRAGSRNTEEALLESHLPVPIAHGTNRGTASLLGAAACTFRACFMARILDLLRCTESGIFKFEFEVVAKIRSALNPTAPTTASTSEHVSETENVAEHIAEVRKDAGIESGVSSSTAQSGMTVTVVCGALLGIGKNRICFGRFLEAIFGLFVSGISVRMVLKRELSIRALHLLVGRRFSDAKNLVIISL
jgi:hypothetical protein